MNEKVFFAPGDVVQLKQDIPNKPTMIVVKKELNLFSEDKETKTLRGIYCRWFTTDGFLQEALFNTKDLIKIENE